MIKSTSSDMAYLSGLMVSEVIDIATSIYNTVSLMDPNNKVFNKYTRTYESLNRDKLTSDTRSSRMTLTETDDESYLKMVQVMVELSIYCKLRGGL